MFVNDILGFNLDKIDSTLFYWILVTMERLPTGSPHFKGVRRQHRQSDYNLKKATCEFVDNAIMICQQITVGFKLSEQGKGNLSQLTISDDYVNGFENMFQEGTNNPFNMTHMRSGQDDDQETSQFGIGLKAGAISTGDKLEVYTKVEEKYYRVEFDFLEMCEREEDSFSPNVRVITEEEYRTRHPYEYGSTLVLSSINPSIYQYTTAHDLKTYLIKELSYTYNDVIRDRNLALKVNDSHIHYVQDIYDTPGCAPFTKRYMIYQYTHQEVIYYMTDDTHCISYCPKTKKLKSVKLSKNPFEKEYSQEIGKITSTFTLYSPYIDTDELPLGRVHIYRKGRRYGCWKDIGSKYDGNKNYNLSRIDIDSKELSKKLGLTYNKNISEESTSEETHVFTLFVKESVKRFNANTSTPANLKLYQIALQHGISVDRDKLPKSIRVPSPAPIATYDPVANAVSIVTASEPPVTAAETDTKPPVTAAETTTETPITSAETTTETPITAAETTTETPITAAETTTETPAEIPLESRVISIPKKSIEVSSYIKGCLTDEQLESLFKQDKNLLKHHPSIIRAYNEIVKFNT